MHSLTADLVPDGTPEVLIILKRHRISWWRRLLSFRPWRAQVVTSMRVTGGTIVIESGHMTYTPPPTQPPVFDSLPPAPE